MQSNAFASSTIGLVQIALQAHNVYQDLQEKVIAAQGNIAIEYFLQKQYAVAHAAYQALIPTITSLAAPKRPAILFNYKVNLICLGEY